MSHGWHGNTWYFDQLRSVSRHGAKRNPRKVTDPLNPPMHRSRKRNVRTSNNNGASEQDDRVLGYPCKIFTNGRGSAIARVLIARSAGRGSSTLRFTNNLPLRTVWSSPMRRVIIPHRVDSRTARQAPGSASAPTWPNRNDKTRRRRRRRRDLRLPISRLSNRGGSQPRLRP